MMQFVSRRGALAALILTAYWIALFVGTHLPKPPEIFTNVLSDKVLHASAFAGLAVLLAWVCQSWFRTMYGLCLFLLAVIPLYAAVDEFLQGFVPYRTPDFDDWVADIGGAALGLLCYFLVRLLRQSLAAAKPAREQMS